MNIYRYMHKYTHTYIHAYICRSTNVNEWKYNINNSAIKNKEIYFFVGRWNVEVYKRFVYQVTTVKASSGNSVDEVFIQLEIVT